MTENIGRLDNYLSYQISERAVHQRNTIADSYLDLLPGRTAKKGQVQVINKLCRNGIDADLLTRTSEHELLGLCRGRASFTTALDLRERARAQFNGLK